MIAVQIACLSVFSDKAGRSVPAPGRGALSIAREVPSKHPLPILDLEYRARQLTFRRNQISQWLANEQELLRGEVEYRKSQSQEVDEDYFASRVADIEREAARQEKDALAIYGMLQGSDERIAPLRRALAVWGLNADDVGVLSIHGTSTGANVNFLFIVFEGYSLILTEFFRRRTRPTSGTTSSPHSAVHQAMLSPLWRRRACAVTQRVVLRRGSWLACFRVYIPALFLATVTLSK